MNTRFARAAIVLSPTLFVSLSAHAHHGLDFLLVQTAHLPERGETYAFVRTDHFSETHDETELEPAVLYAATDWMSLELHGHWARHEGESTEFESVAPAAYFRVTPRQQAFAAGLAVEYEFAQADGHEDALEIASLFGYETSDWNVAANLIYVKEQHASGEWAYAAGFRYNLNARHALGFEAAGSLESGGSSEAMLGYYGRYSETFTWNVGIGTGIDGGADWTARTALIWRLR